MLLGMQGKGSTSLLLMGEQIGACTTKVDVEVPQNAEN